MAPFPQPPRFTLSESLLIDYVLYPRRSREPQGFVRHHNPRDRISEESDPGHYRDDQPNQPHQGDVQVKVLRQPEAHAGNLPAHTRTHQAVSRRYCTHSYATIGTDIRIVLNHLSAIIAVHSVPPGIGYAFRGKVVPCLRLTSLTNNAMLRP